MKESRARSEHFGPPGLPVESRPELAISEAGVARAYKRLAPVYDVLFGQVLEPGRRRMAQVVRSLQPASLLEVGVGTGLALGHYPPTSKIVGIDLSHEMLERARERARALPDHQITVEYMNAERTSFADGTFDCVTLPYVLSVTPRPAELVREIRRICKPGGTIVVLNHFSGSRFWWLMERAFRAAAEHIGFRSDFRYEEQILAHDWQVVSVEPVNLLGLSKLVVLKNRRS